MINQSIYKILHGSDSLDLPYVYSNLLNDDKKKIIKFTKKVIDTRFLCEYFKISQIADKKCSIYEAMLYFETISDVQYKKLNDIHESMGPIQDISWDISNMSSYHLRYALYDVLFLKHFLFNIYRRIRHEIPDKVLTFNYIISIMRFIFIERRNYTNFLETAKNEINPLNNYHIKLGEKNMTLISIFNELVQNFVIEQDDKFIDITFILAVNYFKNSVSIILRKIVYSVILKEFEVFKNRNEVTDESLDLDTMYQELTTYKFGTVARLFKLFESETIKKLKLDKFLYQHIV